MDCPFLLCRGEKTRTSGLYVPNVARYQLRYTPPFLRLQKYIFFDYLGSIYFFLPLSLNYQIFFLLLRLLPNLYLG